MQHGPVEHHGDDTRNQSGGHFGAAVGCRACKDFEAKGRLGKMKQAFPAAEYKQAHQGCHGIPQTSGHGRSADSHVQNGDENIIQYHVQHASRYGADQGKGCLLGGNHIEGKVVHQQNGDGKQQIAAQIRGTVARHLPGHLQASENAAHDRISQNAHH